MERPRLVGREPEWRALHGWLDAARDGDGRLVLIAGEPGIGKTALVAALADTAGRHMLVAWGRSMEQVGASPLRPFRQIAAALGDPDRLDADRLDADRGDDPVAERFARFEAFSEWLVRTAKAHGGALVVLDDVHAADEATLRLLIEVAGTTEGSPLLLVATYRDVEGDQVAGFPTVLDALIRLPRTERLPLRGLDRAAVVELLGNNADVLDRVVAATNGNPLFVTELARHLAAGGAPDAVPHSVRDAVHARLARLGPDCVAALQIAAVAGRRFSAGVIATALDQPAMSVLERLHEATASGFVETTETPGTYQFVHALVRDAIEATLSAAALPAAHQRVAEAIERYEGADDDNLADLARHWDIAAVLGDRALAAEWCERAADAADLRLAWEEAARLYERAAELGGPTAGAAHRCELLLRAARNRLHSDDVGIAVERCAAAADAARAAGRADLLAEAALVVEGRGGATAEPIGRLAEDALAAVGDTDPTWRARLLGQLATVAFYRDPERLATLTAQSLDAAAATDDPLAIVAATRARQMMCASPEGAAERLELAARIGDAGRRLGRPTVTQWEHLWRIDALVELGRLPEAMFELQRLRAAVAQAPVPIARWHLARTETLLAQMAGRYSDAQTWAIKARDLFAAHEDPEAARMMWFGVRQQIAEHIGYDDDLRAFRIDPAVAAPAYLGDLPVVGEGLHRIANDDLRGAGRLHDRLAPADAWRPPPFLLTHLTALRIALATRLGRVGELPALVDLLSPYRHFHATNSAGALVDGGPVELHLGIAAKALGRWDDAIDDLTIARDRSLAAGARGFAVQAAVELAEALQDRGAAGDSASARVILDSVRSLAAALGMAPWVGKVDHLRSTATPSDAAVLSRREAEVASLVAQGLTNRQIAERLYLSERTAQNHVQHILGKLGFATRAQIAAWHARQF